MSVFREEDAAPAPTPVQVTVRSGSPVVRIYIFDNDYRVVAEGSGLLRTALPPGIYKIRCESGSAWGEDFFELPANAGPVEVQGPKLRDLITPAPLLISPETGPDEEQLARRLSMGAVIPKGAGSWLFLFVRGMAEGLGLYDFDGRPVVDIGALPEEQDRTGCNVELDPGSYVLRLERPGGETLEQTIVTCPGWQTQVFPPVEQLNTTDPAARPNLASSAIFMARAEKGFQPAEEELDWSEMARQELARGRVAAGAEISLPPAADTNGDLPPWPQGDMPLIKLERVDRNPMLGIYAAHLMMIRRDPDLKLMRSLADRLRSLVGFHPDVEAIYLWLEAAAPVKPFPNPPMLRSSWSILVNRSRGNESLIPPGSYALDIADRLWGAGAWLVWRKPEPGDQAVVAKDPAGNWMKLSAWVTDGMGTTPPRDFVREIAAQKQLRGLEVTILRYFAEVLHAQQQGQNLVDMLDRRAMFLGPRVGGWVRKRYPTKLSSKLAGTADAFLSRDKIVANLGLPLGAVDQAIAGLTGKLAGT